MVIEYPFATAPTSIRFRATKIAFTFLFSNGYGASVINYGYGDDRGLYELCVLQQVNNKWEMSDETDLTNDLIGYLTPTEVDRWEMSYETALTNDLIGYLTSTEVDQLLDQIKTL